MSASNPIPPAKEAVTAKMSRWASDSSIQRHLLPKPFIRPNVSCWTRSVVRWAAISNTT